MNRSASNSTLRELKAHLGLLSTSLAYQLDAESRDQCRATDVATDRLANNDQRDPRPLSSVLPVFQRLAGFAQPSQPVGTSESQTRIAT